MSFLRIFVVLNKSVYVVMVEGAISLSNPSPTISRFSNGERCTEGSWRARKHEIGGRLLLLAWERCWSPDPQTVQRGARALVMTRLGLGGLQARLLLRPVALSAVSLPPRPMTLHRFYINTKRPDIGLELSEEDWACWMKLNWSVRVW